jgi:prolyl-tRNA editing enzyme YbaK/EbsC (Cys-tRNA(Pro) deacylase)
MMYHPTVKQIISLLTEHECWFTTFEHEPTTTSEESANVRPEYTLHHGAKAMIVRVKISETNKKYVMLVFPGDHKFDRQKVQYFFEAKDVRLATPEEVGAQTGGIQIGGVPPFGQLFGMEVIVDPSLLENEQMIFNAGDRCFSIAMGTADYKNLVHPVIAKMI